MVRHCDFDVIQMPFVRQHDVRAGFTHAIVQQFADLFELRGQLCGLCGG